MLTLIFNLLLINFFIVTIVDFSDFPDSAKKCITFILTKGKISTNKYRFHLVDCSYCITWWFSLIYILCIGQFCVPAVVLCIANALATSLMVPTINMVMDIYKTLINIV
ncbi:MAG: hypothetical protein KBT03_02725 [Bacteroidales bacterium]|nr:hypothetical protein [Candidatus Scybalousia scybalohippi]